MNMTTYGKLYKYMGVGPKYKSSVQKVQLINDLYIDETRTALCGIHLFPSITLQTRLNFPTFCPPSPCPKFVVLILMYGALHSCM